MNAQPAPASLWLLLAAFLGAVLLNVHHAAAWSVVLAVAAAAWRARAPLRPPRPQRRSLRIAVVGAMTLAVLLAFRTLNGIAAGSTLLIVMSALKLGETAGTRDWLIVLAADAFLLLAACLDAEALWRLPAYALELWLLCAALYGLQAGPAAALPRLFGSAGRALLLAAPLALLLFLFVPRLQGSFWSLPESRDAVTGLGDEMSPGSISQLIDSDAPALRARFSGALPPPAQRYWRGPVLHDFDGFTWRRGHPRQRFPAQPLSFEGEGYRYAVTLEPGAPGVLIALEQPAGPPAEVPAAREDADHELIAPPDAGHALRYRLLSYPDYRSLAPLDAQARRTDLALPAGRNPRTLALAQELRRQAGSDTAYVLAVLDYLHRGDFRYSRTPPTLGRDSIDDLLFDTREGFCGHYASAYATLMRAGGVPARVVTGYLGGAWNRFGGYLLIRQSDAHAWTEVWLDGRGWTRIDPTAVVAPERLTDELAGLLPAAGSPRALYSAPWLAAAVQAWQALNAAWQDDVLGFNHARQRALLERLGLHGDQTRTLILLLAIGGGLWLASLALGLHARPQRRADALSRSWRLLERKLRPSLRAAHEGPLAFAERVAQSRPEIGGAVRALARRYAELRYGPERQPGQLERLRRDVRRLRIPPRRRSSLRDR